ncbi:DUF1499 domain-containing protein [Pseudohalocynthiibacter aestuariivivens]|nr:DUF1499 domain-containing protein [Pseudohalocynthiibacter aestuariivivens]QIE44157.1 DUF1499 domain-containing protein [Pseudohalocynthiibacter aestuariivivens]
MKWAMWLGLFTVALLGVWAWVRLAPSDATRWHVMPSQVADTDMPSGAMRVVAADLAQLDTVIRATPRTVVLAGSVESGMITYVTRSKVVGFPDYTTVRRNGEKIEIYGRLRFGKSDLGVNATRVDGWLEALRQRG